MAATTVAPSSMLGGTEQLWEKNNSIQLDNEMKTLKYGVGNEGPTKQRGGNERQDKKHIVRQLHRQDGGVNTININLHVTGGLTSNERSASVVMQEYCMTQALWLQYHLRVVGQHGVLCEVKL